jgi:ABC-type uncharacterized transport system substrate-binding protein
MPSKKLVLVILAAFTAVAIMSVFFAVPSAIGGEEVGEALQSAANFTGTNDDVKEILDRFTTQEKEIIQDSKNPPPS